MKPRVIGIDATNIRAGGGLTHLDELLKQLAGQRDRVVHLWVHKEVLERVQSAANIHIRTIPEWKFARWLSRTLWQTFLFPALLRQLRAEVLVVLGSVYLGRFHPFVVLAQNQLPFNPEERARSGLSGNRLRLHILELLQGFTFRRSAGVVFMSEFSRREIKKRLATTFRNEAVVYHGVNDRFRRPARVLRSRSKDACLNLLYISILEKYKHQDELIAGMALLKRRGVNVRLTLIGPGKHGAVAEIARKKRELSLSDDDVVYYPAVAHSEIAEVYADCDAFVFASSCETFGMIAVEAMASGLPLICSNRSAMPEICGDAPLYFDPLDPESFASVVESLANNPQALTLLSENSVSRAARFSWVESCSSLVVFLDKVFASTDERMMARQFSSEEGRFRTLDQVVVPGSVRVISEVLVPIKRVEGQFFAPARSLRLLINYWSKVGLVHIVRKVRSRLDEKFRNEKWVVLGKGTIVEAAADVAAANVGRTVSFVVPNDALNASSYVVDIRCIERYTESSPVQRRSGSIVVFAASAAPNLERLAGWSPFSGFEPPREEIAMAHRWLRAFLSGADSVAGVVIGSLQIGVMERCAARKAVSGSHTAIVLGWGNYAKTVIRPSIEPLLTLIAVHELDPSQLQFELRNRQFALDTAPFLRMNETADCIFVAGFHHTHADLACDAMCRGMYAAVEKPLATTAAGFARLKAGLEGGGRMFACFHKRFDEWNEVARNDLGCSVGSAIDYHCVVYEVPLPRKHWYNWQSSGSRLISNGCHWIDHFLYLNGNSLVVYRKVEVVSQEVFVVSLRLENGAVFSMTLTERGSERLGVREYVELCSAASRVRIIDSRLYESERGIARLRRIRRNPMSVYAKMYQTIAWSVARGRPGDDLSTLYSTQLVLELEQEVAGSRKGGECANN